MKTAIFCSSNFPTSRPELVFNASSLKTASSALFGLSVFFLLLSSNLSFAADTTPQEAALLKRIEVLEQEMKQLKSNTSSNRLTPASNDGVNQLKYSPMSELQLSLLKGRGNPTTRRAVLEQAAANASYGPNFNSSAPGTLALSTSISDPPSHDRLASPSSPNSSASSGSVEEAEKLGRDQQNQRDLQREQDARNAVQQPLVFDRKLSIETGLTYTRVDRRQLGLSGFYALDAIFLGKLTLDQVKGNTWMADVTTRYGITDRLNVDLNLPYVYRDNLYVSEGLGGAGNVQSEAGRKSDAIGDASIGMTYQFAKASISDKDVIASFRVRAPTGRNPFGVKLINPTANSDPSTTNSNLNIPEGLPTGNGVWSLIGNLSLIKTIDPLVVFGNIGATYNKSRHFADISPGDGTPGTIKLGDSVQVGAGFAFAVNDTTSFSLGTTIIASRASEIRPEGQGWQSIAGSSGNAASLNLGVTHAFSKTQSINTSLSIGLTNDAPNYSVGVRIPYTY